MKYEKVIAFIVMTGIIVVATIVSINIFLNDNKSIGASFLAESETGGDNVRGFLSIDENVLLGNESKSDSQGVINQLQSIMTFEDEMAFEVVKAKRGETVLCSYGCSEFILSEGSAKASFEEDKGFIDVTNGGSLENQGEILQNHLYVLLEETNSGAVVTSDEATFLIRGGYTIKK